MESSEAFGKALRQRREIAGLSQEQLALSADLQRVFVSWLENGKKQPTLLTMLKLAPVLGCRAADLVSDTESLLSRSQNG